MYRLQRATLVAFVLSLLLVMPLQAALSDQPEKALIPQPTVDLSPEDVVKIVINALARNDKPYPDAGIATTFAFASPANKVNTGPLEKFVNMVKNDVYGIMVNHLASEFSEVVLSGNLAYQMVQLTGRNGSKIVFAFRLGKQLEGEFEGMWMTDAVWPIGTVTGSEQAF